MQSPKLRAVVAALVCAGLCLSAQVGRAARPDLSAARDALTAKNYTQVIALAQEIVDAGNADGETYFLLGEAQKELGQFTEAEASFNQAFDKRYKEPEALAGWSEVMVELGHPEEVANAVEKPLSKEKDLVKQAMLKYALGIADIALGNYSSAQANLLGAVYDNQDELKYREALGHAYYLGQIPLLAIAEYDKVVAADSTRLDILYRIAEIHYNQRQLNNALPVLTTLLQRDSTYFNAYFMLANINMIAAESRPRDEARQFYIRALSLYRRVREVDPEADPILVAKNIAKVWYILEQHDSAKVELNNAIATGADDPELQFYLGRSNMLLGDYADAVRAFRGYRGRLEKANPPRQWTQGDAELFWRTAVCLDAQKDSTLLPEIAANYSRALELDPEDERVIGGLAYTLHRMGRYLEAAVEYEKLVTRHPEDARTLFNASLPYLRTENNEKAVEFLLRAARADTSSDGQFRERGYKLAAPILIKLQRISDARQAYKWLIDNEPDICDHKQWYGYTLFATKDYAGCIPHLRRAYQCNEQRTPGGCGHNELRFWLAYSLYETGKVDEAYELLEKVVDCSPDNMDARNLINRIDEETIEE